MEGNQRPSAFPDSSASSAKRFAGLSGDVKIMFGDDDLLNEHYGGANKGSPVFCRYRIGVNTPALQAGHAGSNPATCSIARKGKNNGCNLEPDTVHPLTDMPDSLM